MKIKKSELLALIKEEIMAEAEMFQMSDDDVKDFSIPDPPEYKASEEVFNMVMIDLEKMIEDDLLDIIKEIIMERPESKPQDMAAKAMNALMQKLRANPMMEEAELQEGMDAESMQIVADAVQKMAPLIGVMSLPVLVGLIYEQLKNMGAK